MYPKPDALAGSLSDLIDRVVDGGLTPEQLRVAVARLDTAENGWRRCALAFIEQQCLGEIMRDWDEEQPSRPDVIPLRPRLATPQRLALAASLAMLAFGLGWVGHQVSAKPSGEPILARRGDSIEDRGLTPPARPETLARRGSPDPAGTDDRRSPIEESGRDARTTNEPLLARREVPDAAEIPNLGRAVHAIPSSSPGADEEGIPIVVGPDLSPLEEWMSQQPPTISEFEKAALEREGYRVDQRREVMIGTLDDGRLAAVPVENVQVKYVGHLPL